MMVCLHAAAPGDPSKALLFLSIAALINGLIINSGFKSLLLALSERHKHSVSAGGTLSPELRWGRDGAPILSPAAPWGQPGDSLGTAQGQPGDILGTPWGSPGYSLGTSWGQLVYDSGTAMRHLRGIVGTPWVPLRNTLGTALEQLLDTLGTAWGHPRAAPRDNPQARGDGTGLQTTLFRTGWHTSLLPSRPHGTAPRHSTAPKPHANDPYASPAPGAAHTSQSAAARQHSQFSRHPPGFLSRGCGTAPPALRRHPGAVTPESPRPTARSWLPQLLQHCAQGKTSCGVPGPRHPWGQNCPSPPGPVLFSVARREPRRRHRRRTKRRKTEVRKMMKTHGSTMELTERKRRALRSASSLKSAANAPM